MAITSANIQYNMWFNIQSQYKTITSVLYKIITIWKLLSIILFGIIFSDTHQGYIKFAYGNIFFRTWWRQENLLKACLSKYFKSCKWENTRLHKAMYTLSYNISAMFQWINHKYLSIQILLYQVHHPHQIWHHQKHQVI